MRDGFTYFTFSGFNYYVVYELAGDDNEPEWGKVSVYFNATDDDPIPAPADVLVEHARAAARMDAKVHAQRCNGCGIRIFEWMRFECEACVAEWARLDGIFEVGFKEGGKR